MKIEKTFDDVLQALMATDDGRVFIKYLIDYGDIQSSPLDDNFKVGIQYIPKKIFFRLTTLGYDVKFLVESNTTARSNVEIS